MRTAIAASEAVRGTTSPNPPVGAVILDADGRTVGVGATQPPGGPHAEVMAVRAAGEAAAGGTAIVTLEPCSHTGRTPPCTDLLKSVGVAEVYFAVADPNPVAAGGQQVLAEAGIPAHQGLLGEDVERGPLRAWLHHARTGRPHVTWKYAMTMDGRVAAQDGSSRWISGTESRAEVHELRRAMDAIIAGTGTVRADDPQLTVREADGTLLDRQPLRVVVGLGDLPSDAKVLDDAAETIVLKTRKPAEVLATLGARGVVDVLLEGGPRLAGAFLQAGLIDRALAYLAPKLLGSGPTALGDAGVATITQAHLWTVESATMKGPDVRISAVPVREVG
ncbi:MAG TPA: bifunctional diaminohydroxyphosphoribosylaminopyrimidine deaminase/5-amino-6-(5-phosphoribosylamino)uracil reductase RibD [Pseudonocardiaceae bacterium]|nr:bifunctional diaminohydroxyphosphoribosylaminopyrimidine deaminase/5-amino-6-(5-phosphoribosylamino)uracil reductase RibD [Pseudonocardiaceae bacterium]